MFPRSADQISVEIDEERISPRAGAWLGVAIVAGLCALSQCTVFALAGW